MKTHYSLGRKKRTLVAVGFGLAVAGIGLIFVLSRAASPNASLEAEDGTIAGAAKAVNDSSASGGRALRFQAQPTGSASSVYGMTVDTVSNVNNIVAATSAAPRKLTTRIVFDEGTTPSDYTAAVTAIHPHSFIMGELLDSESLKTITTAQYQDRTTQFVNALGNQVDIWEIGNEVNGNWTGPYADVSAKISASYNVVKNAGKQAALTLYYDIGCGNGPSELDPIAFSNSYVPASMKQGLDYVLLSYYEGDCNNIRPSTATWKAYYDQLHQIYPNAKLGFGEVGLPKAATSTTLAGAQTLLNYYYGLHITTPNYIGGYFWWYAYQDFLPVSSNKPLWQSFVTAIQGY